MSPPKDQHSENPDDLTVEQIRSALHDTAQAYQPSRAAIELRVAHGRAAPAGKGRHGARAYFTMRPVGAALAVVVISVLSVFAFRSGILRPPVADPPATAPVAAAPSPSPAPSTTSNRAGASSGHSRLPTTPSRSGAPSSASRSTPAGFLSAVGAVDPNSVDTWSQNNVTISNTAAVTSLLITIKVALTAEAADAGRYTTVPNSDITVTVTRDATTMTYSYALRTGATLAPGSYIFAAQFVHHAGRDAGRDSYSVAAQAGSADATLDGTFA